MCNREVLSKDTEEIWQYLDSLTDYSQTWKSKNAYERNQTIVVSTTRDRVIKHWETKNIAVRLITLTKKVGNFLTR